MTFECVARVQPKTSCCWFATVLKNQSLSLLFNMRF